MNESNILSLEEYFEKEFELALDVIDEMVDEIAISMRKQKTAKAV